ncbi:cobalamin biosynthesis protein [Actinoplanes sp. CA-030573]|uniref:cobalamin biosynthesis protein n=1 Tax=Actinoplanes sp. CA-030573 TaxID=3239898 RepID=UPI003D8E3EED
MSGDLALGAGVRRLVLGVGVRRLVLGVDARRLVLGVGVRRLVLGVGARRGTPAAVLTGAIRSVLGEAGLTAADVGVLATIDRRAAEDGFREVAAAHGWELVALAAADLAARDVPNASDRVAAAVGTPSVAEAAALAAAGRDAELVLPKRVVDGVTVAVAKA